MKTRVRVGTRALAPLAALLLIASAGRVCAEDLPKISELNQPKEKQGAAAADEKKAAYPAKLEAGDANLAAADLLPPNPYFYIQASSGEALFKALGDTKFFSLLKDRKFSAFLSDNPFNLANLFIDLPGAYAKPESVNACGGLLDFIKNFSGTPGSVTLAAYRGDEKGPQVVFLAAMPGLERKEPFERLQALKDVFLAANPSFKAQDADHGDDYVDVVSGEKAELAVGMVRNYAVACTSGAFARNLIDTARRGGGSLGTSPAYLELAPKTSPASQVRGFVDMRALLAEVSANELPGAVEMLDFACDVAGRGKKDGIIYYDLSVTETGTLEHLVSPAAVETEAGELPGIPARLLQVCKPSDPAAALTTTKLVPYQPDFFLAAFVKPGAFADLLEQSQQPFGGSAYATQLAISIPESLRSPSRGILRQIKGNIDALLTGEIAMALLPGKDGAPEWLFILSVNNATEAASAVASGEPAETVSGVGIYSLDKERWKKAQCWAVLGQGNIQNLNASQIVVASSGELMQTVIDQAVAVAASLAENRDFQQRAAAIGQGYSLVWYYNLPAQVSRNYIDFNKYVSSFFPRIKTAVSRPPMSLLSDHVCGLIGGVKVESGAGTVSSTFSGPFPAAPALSALLALEMPSWIRERSRRYLSESRLGMGNIWLALQTYATNYGHYPENMDELRRLFPQAQQARNFLTPAAVAKVGLEEAARRSYSYVRSLRPTDEPDMPILYESEPWHDEYRGMLQPQPAEEGPYLQWRLVLTIDGNIRAYTDEEFNRLVLPRIKARE